jgi:hypothetical protein
VLRFSASMPRGKYMHAECLQAFKVSRDCIKNVTKALKLCCIAWAVHDRKERHPQIHVRVVNKTGFVTRFKNAYNEYLTGYIAKPIKPRPQGEFGRTGSRSKDAVSA